jgi:hypothetical protein
MSDRLSFCPKKVASRRACAMLAGAFLLFSLALISPALGEEEVVLIKAFAEPTEIYFPNKINYMIHIRRDFNTPKIIPKLPEFGEFKLIQTQEPATSFYDLPKPGGFKKKCLDIYTYSLQTPMKPQIYTIEPASIEFGGQKFFSEPVEVLVAEKPFVQNKGIFQGAPFPITSPVKSRIDKLTCGRLHLIPQVSASESYVGEQIRVLWSLYIAESLLREFNFINNKSGGAGFKAGPKPHEVQSDFFVHVLRDWEGKVNPQKEEIDGVKYLVFPLRELLLFAKNVEANKIPPFYISCDLIDKESKSQFLFRNDYKLMVISLEPHLKISNLPNAGRPRDFSGIVGTTISLEAKIDKSTSAINQTDNSFDVNVKLSGHANLEGAPAPKLSNFDKFDTKNIEEIVVNKEIIKDKFWSERVWKYSISKRQISKDAPIFEFSYFDLDSKIYKNVRIEATSIASEP